MEITKNPIFVFGCPRSGQTLCASILNKHPDMLIFFEKDTFNLLYRCWLYRLRAEKDRPREHFSSIIKKSFCDYNSRFDISPKNIEECALKGEGRWADMLDCYMRFLMLRAKPSGMRWGDKSPGNINSISHIKQQYPDAQFIFLYRDPRHVVASLSKKSFWPATDDYLINADVFKQYMSLYEAQKTLIDADNLLEVKYEDLVSEPEINVRNICGFLNVEYKDSLLEAADAKTRDIVGLPDYMGWGKIVSRTVQLNEKEEPYIEAYLSCWIDRLGYVRKRNFIQILNRLLAELYLLSFKATRRLLSIFWNKRYPGFPFLMLKYPMLNSMKRWLGGTFNIYI